MNVVVLGGNGGIGAALISRIRHVLPSASINATWHKAPPPPDSVVNWSQVDLGSEKSIQQFAAQFDQVHWIINAVGVLHQESLMPEKNLQQLDPDYFMQNMQLNALPALLLAKHFKSALRKAADTSEIDLQFTTVSARVGSIEDNRLGGWHSYRCSKAALNMAIKNISIEWRRTLPSVCVTALHPGTTNTALSAPFQRNVPDGKLFTAEKTANYLVALLSTLRAADTGKFLAYDGVEIPW